jgi:hypothetical protein
MSIKLHKTVILLIFATFKPIWQLILGAKADKLPYEQSLRSNIFI